MGTMKRRLFVKVHRIKMIFHGWLFLFIVIGFLIVFFVSWFVHSHLAKSAAVDLLRVQLRYASAKIDETQKVLKEIADASSQTALGKARLFARLVELDPSVVQKPEDLEKIKKLLDVDELHVSDENGILIASLPNESYIGYDMASKKQSSVFMPA